MAGIAEVGATKGKKPEKEQGEVTIYFGVFFDGTNNHRLQVLIGKMYRAKHEKELKGRIEKLNKNIALYEDMLLSSVSDYDTSQSLQLLSQSKNELEEVEKKLQNVITDDEKAIIEDFSFDLGEDKDKRINNGIGDINTLGENVDSQYKGEDIQNNDFTNIALLEPFYQAKNNQEENEYVYRIYVSGSGTNRDLKKVGDNKGAGFGQGDTGVMQKINDALSCINMKLQKFPAQTNLTLYFDVFGFSRGATEARLFVNAVDKGNTVFLKTLQGLTESRKPDSASSFELVIGNYRFQLNNLENRIRTDAKLSHTEKEKCIENIKSVRDEFEQRVAETRYLFPSEENSKTARKYYKKAVENCIGSKRIFAGRVAKNVEFRTLGIYDTVSSVGVLEKELVDSSTHIVESAKNLEIRSMYDTVVDYGINLLGSVVDFALSNGSVFHKDNVEDLGLRNLSSVKKVLHICAADEYRENFALVSLGKPIGNAVVSTVPANCIEIYVPGCHADVGGGYVHAINGYKVLLNKNYYLNKNPIADTMKKLWNAKEIDDGKNPFISDTKSWWNVFKSGCFEFKHYPKKGYNYITLHAMADWANRECPGIFKKSLIGKSTLKEGNLKTLFEKIENAIKKGGLQGSMDRPISPWGNNSEEYKNLRQQFLHFSTDFTRSKGVAHVNTPSFNIINGNREISRKIY